MSGDAHHIVSPPPAGLGSTALCMSRALANAGASASDICYINAHATSTPIGAPIRWHGNPTSLLECTLVVRCGPLQAGAYPNTALHVSV